MDACGIASPCSEAEGKSEARFGQSARLAPLTFPPSLRYGLGGILSPYPTGDANKSAICALFFGITRYAHACPLAAHIVRNHIVACRYSENRKKSLAK